MLSSLITALIGLFITAIGAALFYLVFWSLRTGDTFYGHLYRDDSGRIKRVNFRKEPTTFIWALIGDLIFGAVLLYIGIGTLLLSFK